MAFEAVTQGRLETRVVSEVIEVVELALKAASLAVVELDRYE